MITLRRLIGSEIAAVLPLRGSIQVLGKDAGFEDREAERDAASFVFGYYQDLDLVGTMRVLPFASGLSPIESNVRRLSLSPSLADSACEMGRLSLDPRYRGPTKTILGCWAATYDYMHRHASEYRNGFLMAAPALARLYGRFGCTLVHWFNLEGSTEPLALMHTDLDKVRQLLAAPPITADSLRR